MATPSLMLRETSTVGWDGNPFRQQRLRRGHSGYLVDPAMAGTIAAWAAAVAAEAASPCPEEAGP